MPSPGRIRRARKFQERPWLWLIISVAIALAAIAAGFFGIRRLQENSPGEADPMFALIVGLGILGLVLILVTFVYSARKRGLQERMHVGTMMGWLNAHVYLGFIALIVILAHAFLFPFNPQMTTGKIALLVFAVLVLSGLLWRLVYRAVPPRVAESVGNLSIVDTYRRKQELRLRLEKLQAGKSREFDALVDDVLNGRIRRRETNKRCARLAEAERALWPEVAVILDELDEQGSRENRQQRFSVVLQVWRAIHLPLALALLVGIGFHLFDVFELNSSFKKGPEARFASSEDCATCHESIVDEWKTSMHRNAQTSTITVAQAPVTLGKGPEWGQVCVACHAPIGTMFSQRATFPLSDPHPLDNPDSVEEEGVTCVVCHTLPHPPDEIGGANAEGLGYLEREARSYGKMFGPPLEDPEAIPNSAHDVATGFMKDTISSSQMCAACHNVVADVDGDGIVKKKFQKVVDKRFPPRGDRDGDEILNENELDIGRDGQLQDLALQLTFNEWEDYLALQGGRGASCVDCHMPQEDEPLIDAAPLGVGETERRHQRHIFIGVDYDMNDRYYRQAGMPDDAMEEALHDRELLVAQSVFMDVKGEGNIEGPQTTVQVKLDNITGHAFPTGFAFARQFWIQITAKTASGQKVCLVDPNGIQSPCSSGVIGNPRKELATCRPGPNNPANLGIRFSVDSPLSDCDPWLANFQKILTDGGRGPRRDPQPPFTEVAFQTLTNDIVKLRERAADGLVMAAIPPLESTKIPYTFDTTGLEGEKLKVRAVMRLRHLPPYFVKALDKTMPGNLTAEKLLENMTIVNVASNRELGEDLTTPSVEEFKTDKLGGFLSAAPDPEADDENGPSRVAYLIPIGLLPLLLLFAVRRRSRRTRA